MKRILININELSELTGLSVGTLYQWVSQRKIPYVKVGRLTKFDLGRIKKWLEENSFEPKRSWVQNT